MSFLERHVHALHEVQFLQRLQLLQDLLPSWSSSGAMIISVMAQRGSACDEQAGTGKD